MSLLILEQTGLLRHSTACRHLYILALSKFDIVKNSICIDSFLLVL